VCQKPPADYAKKLVNFVIYLSKLRQTHNYNAIFAADETAIWLNPLGGKCIDEKGAKEADKILCLMKVNYIF
jgi:hypothetical protein